METLTNRDIITIGHALMERAEFLDKQVARSAQDVAEHWENNREWADFRSADFDYWRKQLAEVRTAYRKVVGVEL